MGYQRTILPTFSFVVLCAILWSTYNLSRNSFTNTEVVKNTMESIETNLPQLPTTNYTEGVREEMFRRKERLCQLCKTASNSSLNITQSKERYIIYPPKNLLYCYVAKAGCTYWKRVFLALQHWNDNNTRWTKFLRKAHRSSIHRLKIDTLQRFSFDKAQDYLRSAKKFLFVRDPYDRLFSAYVDKFVLGDFWNSYGKMVVKQMRQNPSNVSQDCGHDVTFEEFLKYVVLHSASNSANGGDEHWSPVSKLCNPCSLDFDLIGKQESFSKDRHFILSEFQLPDFLSSLEETSFENNAVSSMIQSAVLLWHRTALTAKQCQTYSLKRESLLKGFSYQGYLEENNQSNWLTKNETLREFIMNTRILFRKQNLRTEVFYERRRRAKISAYKNVSVSFLYAIKEIFKMDFLLFDYDPMPTEIFKNR